MLTTAWLSGLIHKHDHERVVLRGAASRISRARRAYPTTEFGNELYAAQQPNLVSLYSADTAP